MPVRGHDGVQARIEEMVAAALTAEREGTIARLEQVIAARDNEIRALRQYVNPLNRPA